MKILLTGKNGQVGFELRRSLSLLGEVVAVGVEDCNLSNGEDVQRLVRRHKPDVIVNPAAYTAVDKAESEASLAQAVNARAPEIFAQEAEKLGAMLLHFSTDYVFDGNKAGAYVESDVPNPQSVYGATKLLGEKAVSRLCARHLVLRTSWVVGAHGRNFAKTILRLAAERDSLSVVADQFGVPTSAAMLADLTAQLVRQATQNRSADRFPYGLYHVTASGVTNWHEYACYVIEYARRAGTPIRVSPGAVRAITAADYPAAAKRPLNSRLDTSKFVESFGLRLPSWQESLDHILDQIL
ncbi:MAG: dTDP-4-dehydrorhamnose reductase [Nevskiaceae bacterium]|nr:MAG: dTDP-4-dehydrorhamnose reductase [Nevskiaceae bacterium]